MSAWRDIVDAMPVVAMVRALRRRPHPPSALAALVLAAYAVVCLATPWSTRLQRRIAAVHHLRPPDLSAWIAFQPVPKMYGFEHAAWIGTQPTLDLISPEAAAWRFSAQRFWINHYPARFARFDGRRRELFVAVGSKRWVYLHTGYRGSRFGTAIEVERTADGLRWTPRRWRLADSSPPEGAP